MFYCNDSFFLAYHNFSNVTFKNFYYSIDSNHGILFLLQTEVGVNLQPDYMIKYTFDQESGNIATNEETIIIGFSTQEKKGTLMHIRNDDKIRPEYITVEMNNNGNLT